MLEFVEGFISFIIALTGIASLIILLPYCVYKKTNERQELQDEILKENANLLNKGPFFRVNYCPESQFEKIFWKVSVIDGTGILFIHDTQITFSGSYLSGEKLKLEFNKGNSTLNWIGRKVWKGSGLSWFVINLSGENHYFTSETGVEAVSSKFTTRKIYDQLSNAFLTQS